MRCRSSNQLIRARTFGHDVTMPRRRLCGAIGRPRERNVLCTTVVGVVPESALRRDHDTHGGQL
jgi:hypothetical protein